LARISGGAENEGFSRMRLIARFFGFLFATGAIVFVLGAIAIAGVVWKYQKDLPDYTQLKNYEPPVMTRVHAGDGSLLAEYARERRLYLPSTAIPPLVKQAFISAEDKNFYTHSGIDPEGILRAVMVMVEGKHMQGASTITQQVAKNFLLGNEQFVSSARSARRCCRFRIEIGLFEGQDPRALSQRDLSRPRQLRRRRRGAELFRQVGARADHRRSGLSRGAAEGAEQLSSVPEA
jgi:hypothetical protein